VFIIEYVPGVKFKGHFDNFMSYTEFNYDFADGKLKDTSYQLIGNVRWPATGELVASSDMAGGVIPEPKGGYPAELTEKEQQLILGGEITIWGENLDSMTIEQRLWPRSYAIAERLWSSQELTDERSMYKRMKVMDTWSEISLGLRHHADANMMLKRLANGADETPLQTLAKYIEPAQYYARHWEKWISTPNEGDLYNQYERLNRFADALPVESLAVYEMKDLVAAYAQGDNTALDALAMHYQSVKLAAQQAKPIFAANVASVETVPVADAAIKVADLGLTLIELAKQGSDISQSDAEAYQRIINENAIIFDETIVAIVVPTEQLLHTLTD